MDNTDKDRIQGLEEENIKLKEKLKDKSREIILSITNDKIKHYDNLLWTISTIFAAAIGGLLLHQKNNFNMWLSIFGFLLTVLAVYFAASFRELRLKEESLFRELFKELRKDVKLEKPKEKEQKENKRFFYQWFPYVLIFLVLGIFWIALLIENIPSSFCIDLLDELESLVEKVFSSMYICSIITILLLGEGYMFYLYKKTKKPKSDP